MRPWFLVNRVMIFSRSRKGTLLRTSPSSCSSFICFKFGGCAKLVCSAPIAQLDRVPGFEPGGYRFESCSVQMISIFYHTQDSFADTIFAQLGKGRLHARSLYGYFMRRGTIEGFEVEPEAERLKGEILERTSFELPGYRVVVEDGGTVKFLVDMGEGLEAEAVLIPMKSKTTLCVSSQVGCKMGCTFCETGRMGLLKSLGREEIVAQVAIAVHGLGRQVDNIVFMGMGEPFDNFDEVMGAIGVLCGGLGFGPSRITVSTSGVVDMMDRFTEEADPGVHLAVSVNAPNDEVRKRVMPVNRKWNMAELKGAMARFCAGGKREILVEYVLMEGINDSLESADELAEYLRGLRVKVNLIPYNPQKKDRFAPPGQDVIEAFAKKMKENGYLTLVRQTKGQQIRAACGQLGGVDKVKIWTQTKKIGRMEA